MKINSYDWIKIKQDFFTSDYSEIYPYLRDKYNLDPDLNGAVAKQVRGWSNEKNDLRKQGFEKTKEKIIELYVPTLEELTQMHKGVIVLLKTMLQNEINECIGVDLKTGHQKILKKPDIGMVERIWKIVKSEKLEPTTVQKTNNDLNDEHMELVRKLLDENYNDGF